MRCSRYLVVYLACQCQLRRKEWRDNVNTMVDETLAKTESSEKPNVYRPSGRSSNRWYGSCIQVSI